jgi:hypothetical protein
VRSAARPHPVTARRRAPGSSPPGRDAIVRTRRLAFAMASALSTPRGLSMSGAISIRPGAIPRMRSRSAICASRRSTSLADSVFGKQTPSTSAWTDASRSRARWAGSWFTRTKISAPPRDARETASRISRRAGSFSCKGTASSRSSMMASAPRRCAPSTNRGTLTGRISVDRLIKGPPMASLVRAVRCIGLESARRYLRACGESRRIGREMAKHVVGHGQARGETAGREWGSLTAKDGERRLRRRD